MEKNVTVSLIIFKNCENFLKFFVNDKLKVELQKRFQSGHLTTNKLQQTYWYIDDIDILVKNII
jgi:hypothetical protein